MPNYTDINTDINDLTSDFNISDDLKSTLSSYDESGEKNMWGQLQGQKTLLQDQLAVGSTKLQETAGKGFATSGQRQKLSADMSEGINDKYGGMLDNAMYDAYKMKKDWKDTQMGKISDYIVSGDVTAKTTSTYDGGSENPSGWEGGTPVFGDTHIDMNGDSWVYGQMGWTIDYTNDCFIEGTKIFMPDGSEKEIQDIIEGDVILTFDEKTKSFTQGVVTEHLVHPVSREIPVAIVGGILEGTPSHPIFFGGSWSEIRESKADIKIVKKHIDNYYNLEVDAHDLYGSSHNYIANGYIVSGLGDNDVLNDVFKRQKIFQNKEGISHGV